MLPTAISFRAALNVVVVYGLLAGVIVAWMWLLQRLRERRGILPPSNPRIVPWREGSVLLVVLTFLAVNFWVETVYVGAREWSGHPVGFLTQGKPLRTAPSRSQKTARIAKPDAPVEKERDGAHDEFYSPTDKMVISSLANGILLVVVPLVLRGTSRAGLRDLGLNRAGLAKNVLIGTVAFLIVTPCVYVVFFLALKVFPSSQHPLMEMLVNEMSPGKVALALVSAIVLAPITEELLFRAVLQGWLTRLFARMGGGDQLTDVEGTTTPNGASPDVPLDNRRHRPRSSTLPVVLTSLFFAAVHAPQMPAPIALFFLSVALGVLYQRTGSLIPSITLHALFNGLSTIALLIAAPKPG